MIHRGTHLFKVLFIAGIAVAGLAGTSVVAHAYPPPQETHSLHCSPGAVKAGGTCTLTFTDKAKGEGAGQTVCFDVKGAGTVSPMCSSTNGKGQATTTFTANSGACGNVESKSDDSPAKATVAGTEVEPRDESGRAQTMVNIICPDNDKDGNHGSTSGSTPATTTSARNTAAPVTPLTMAQVVPVAGIVAVILVLAVAITGRLRLRRLRR